ncbi:ATP synthase F1 subunit epsilon [Proteocatella sphenisci]|uniref:ATP synthase F1 subunit epsilon n=1 Tax=Proteocatella sphenisci TaxID=181070 RepID=UPI0004908E0F|nr:ATP synthase F1 subunit epsilon [Proteocatella sphenisci]
MSKFRLRIVTPDQLFMDEEVEALIVKTTEGELTILKDHIDFVSNINIHIAGIKQNGTIKKAAIAGGILQNDKGVTTVIATAAEWSDHIDLDRAERARADSERKMQMHRDNVNELKMAEYRLKKAINRINAAR